MNKNINLLIVLAIAVGISTGEAAAKKFVIKKHIDETTTEGAARGEEGKTPATGKSSDGKSSDSKSADGKSSDGKAGGKPAAPLRKQPKSVLGAGAVITPSGLQYKDVKVGTGASPQKGQVIWVNYTGWTHPEGRKFDSSLDRGVPYNFIIGYQQVIQGWDEAVSTMKVGGKRVIIVPPDLAYGSKGTNVIAPDSTLKYELSLLSIGPKMPKIEPPKPDGGKADANRAAEPAKVPAKTTVKGKPE